MDAVEHVVVHMQENRSFDHYFGTLPGVRGFQDPDVLKLPGGRSVFDQPDPREAGGYLGPWHLDTRRTSSQAIPSNSHAWAVQHQGWNAGAMDSWLKAHLASDGPVDAPFVMGYYEREDIPFQFALAESFTICDAYHASVLGPTWPNRLYLMSGTIDPEGRHGGPVTANVVPAPYTWTTYPERLEAAGVSWRVYQEEDDYGINVLEFFKQYQDAAPGSPLYDRALAISPPGAFEEDARRGTLPAVSWILPTSAQSEHPAFTPAAAADFVAGKLDALASNPELWARSVYILDWDENDGLFDHVPPPVPPPGTPGEFIDGLPIGGGIRVPCIIVSPWTVGGWVSSEPFDHTSVLRLLERVTGVAEPNLTPWRRRAFGDLTSALGFSPPRAFPPLPPTKSEFWDMAREIETLPEATPPATERTPPTQEVRPPRDAPVLVPAGTHRRAARGTTSRLQESRTTHRSDFPGGLSGDTSFPGRLATATELPRPEPGVPSAYVTSLVGGSIAVINTETHDLVWGIGHENSPYGIGATPGGGKLYVTNAGGNSVSVIDPTTGALRAAVVVGIFPHGIALSPDGARAYVANTGPDTGAGGSTTISVIDTSSDEVSATITVGEAPRVPAVTPDGARVVVTCADGVWAVEAAGGAARPLAGVEGAHGIAISPDGRRAWVCDSTRNQVAVLELPDGEVAGRVGVGRMPWNVALTPDGSRAYVTNANSDTVSVIDTGSLRTISSIRVGHVPTGVTVARGTVWVAENTSSTVSAIDLSSNLVTHTVDLGLSTEPTSIVVV